MRDPVSVHRLRRREARSPATGRRSAPRAGRTRSGGSRRAPRPGWCAATMTGVARRPVGSASASAARTPSRSRPARRSTTGAPASCSLALARLRAPMARASREKTASALATVITAITARVSRRRPVSSRVTPADEAAPAQQPTPRRARSGRGEVAQRRSPTNRARSAGPASAKDPLRLPVTKARTPVPTAATRKASSAPSAHRRDGARPLPHQAVERLAGDTDRGRDRRQHQGRHREEDRRREPGTRLERCLAGQQRAGPPRRRASAAATPGTTPARRTGSSSTSSRPTAPAGPRPRSRATATSPRRCCGRGGEHEPEHEQGQHGHRRHQQRHRAVGLAGLGADVVRHVTEARCGRGGPGPGPRCRGTARGPGRRARAPRRRRSCRWRTSAPDLRGLARQDRTVDERLLGRQPGVVGGRGVGALGDRSRSRPGSGPATTRRHRGA